MTADEFAGLVGDQIAHCTYGQNAASINEHGLLTPALLAQRCGVDPASLILRASRPRLTMTGRAICLNDQRQLVKGRNQAFLDGHTMESWSAQLDRRIFLLPGPGAPEDSSFFATLGGGAKAIRFDTRLFFEAFSPNIWLSPINSGNADRRPAPRGDWLYVPVSASRDEFRLNRVRRGLKAGPDTVVEISITAPIAPDLLRDLLAA